MAGLLTQLLTLPLAPARGLGWVMQQVAREAERQYYDPGPVERELAALEGELVAGRVDQETYDRREDELLDRLEEIRSFWADRQ